MGDGPAQSCKFNHTPGSYARKSGLPARGSYLFVQLDNHSDCMGACQTGMG